MAGVTEPQPIQSQVIAAVKSASPLPLSIRPDVAAWMEADTPEKKRSAVKAHPQLRQIYAAAAEIPN
jgi:hypothetical protein